MVAVSRYTCVKQDDKFSATLRLFRSRKNSTAFNLSSSTARFWVGWCNVFLRVESESYTLMRVFVWTPTIYHRKCDPGRDRQ